ncbi:hypothetical protein [Salibacterium qingdaonense]|uniref:Uncharacterized protein n=1 Tax=Salibacterium qingdaonense TaxID=266892 RepID=A0A1I4QW28_9BACI|nr:hypothetical protein [Salibacterium qingdaonense]SFM44282.1 hypothetical protein SAMN04488054_15116 [Salibacterium qingdaonense]
MQVENPMVLPSGYLDRDDPEILGECEGCGREIADYEEALEFEQDVLLHDDVECLADYIRQHAMKVGWRN